MSICGRQLELYVIEADKTVRGIEIASDQRSQIAAACHDVALEHAYSISLLVQSSLHGSAFALFRLLFEATIRGTWLYRCVSESELEKYVRGQDLGVYFSTMIASIEAQLGPTSRQLSKLHKNSWKIMNSFTHTGVAQIARRLDGKNLRAFFSEDDIQKMTRGAAMFCLLSALELAHIGHSPEKRDRIVSLSKEIKHVIKAA